MPFTAAHWLNSFDRHNTHGFIRLASSDPITTSTLALNWNQSERRDSLRLSHRAMGIMVIYWCVNTSITRCLCLAWSIIAYKSIAICKFVWFFNPLSLALSMSLSLSPTLSYNFLSFGFYWFTNCSLFLELTQSLSNSWKREWKRESGRERETCFI